ncbi:fimbrial assembly [Luminiphilus syltensis NOR5-1B]|uniref:Fimbrial assembly n=1 Tax=Luminiphilus syltensis NOR5-1B TaxID=565045 RepID=B8KUT7_9GAMM|nr:PilN domain-containing protein [Luminiphilus syltensis]EED34636.1 fimbrial assembly [Luminiphilus syltensis NOR5-1B]
MARINLLPWREELRAERKKQFTLNLVGVAMVAVLALVGADRLENSRIENQKQRNAYLEQNIAKLDEKVAEIRDLQKKRVQLIERMRIIQELQGTRPVIVRILDQLVRTLPDGVFYTELTTEEGMITIQGVAESNNRVSSLMRRLDASEWLQDPNLDAVVAAPEFGDQAATFTLTVGVQLAKEGEANGESDA